MDDQKLLEFKVELSKEMKEERHAFRNEIQGKILIIDDINTNQKIMQRDIDAMKEDIRDIKLMLKQFTDEVRWGYVTKPEHEENKKRIAELEKKRESALTEFVKYTISFILAVATTFALVKLWLK